MLLKLSSLPANLAKQIKDQMNASPDDAPISIHAGVEPLEQPQQLSRHISKFCRIRLFWGMIDVEWRLGGF